MDSPPHIQLRWPILSLTLTASVVLSNASAEAQTWQLIGQLNRQVFAIAADYTDPNTIYVAAGLGFSGGLFKTTNLGASWDTLVNRMNVVNVKLDPVDPSIVYACCGPILDDFPGVLKSTDGGTTWMRADSGIGRDPYQSVIAIAIDPLHAETLYAGTGGYHGGNFYKSTDGGRFWFMPTDTVVNGGVGALGIDPADGSTLFAATYYGIWRSTDGGFKWSETAMNVTGFVYSVEVETASQIVHVGGDWRYAPWSYSQSTNQGETWESDVRGLPDSTMVRDLQLLPGQGGSVLAATNRGVFGRTESSGWQQIGVNGPQYVSALAISGSRVFAGSNDVYSAEIISAVGDMSIAPQEFHLFQNYPNPFNGGTWITFDLPLATFVRVAIFDLLGRQMSILEEGFLAAGTYKRRWDAGRFASGVYMCRMEAEGSMVAMKLALVR
ncbi:MAG: T9SS type A sorting domain-containing protein [Bacteroidota bacterium]